MRTVRYCDCGNALYRTNKSGMCQDCIERGVATANLAEDVEWLIDMGEAPRVIARRLGSSASAIERRLYRAGRHDLAALFAAEHDRSDYYRAYNQAHRQPCAGTCGGTISRRSASGLCRKCVIQVRAKAPRPRKVSA